ncbi:MAG TPA: hypothetical protein VFO58_16815 [Vicinamibacterales bacterium]|nr:hypothetical protein [Vicinamibacterales bacterium]
MRGTWRAFVLAAALSAAAAAPALAQVETAASPAVSREVMEQLLLKGETIATKGKSKGVTEARRVTLRHESLTHDAQIQDVDISMPIFQVDPKHTEVDFKDSYRYNIAAYRLSLLLGLDNVPMSVERVINGKPAAVTWWLDDVMMEEGDRLKRKENKYGPSALRTVSQTQMMSVFDELIQNRDRNAGNVLWTKDWKMWMIDHTRAFRTGKDLLKPKDLERCERTMFQKMNELTAQQLAEVMGRAMTKREIEALLARRDRLVKLFNEKIAKSTEAAVLFTMPSA